MLANSFTGDQNSTSLSSYGPLQLSAFSPGSLLGRYYTLPTVYFILRASLRTYIYSVSALCGDKIPLQINLVACQLIYRWPKLHLFILWPFAVLCFFTKIHIRAAVLLTALLLLLSRQLLDPFVVHRALLGPSYRESKIGMVILHSSHLTFSRLFSGIALQPSRRVMAFLGRCNQKFPA